jgi:Domain of unknown function (DUF4173)
VTAARLTPMALVAIGAIAAATLVGRPAGLGLTMIAWALIAVAVRPRDRWRIAWWIAAAALAAVATVRAAGWIVWPSLAMAAVLGSLAAAGGAAWWPLAVGAARVTRLDRGLELVARATPGPQRAPLLGAGLGIGLLAVFVPLFATADAAFAHLLGELVPNDVLDRPAARAAVWVGAVGVGGALLWAGRAPAVDPALPAHDRLGRLESTVPMIALVVLFAVFVAFQLTALYGGNDYVLHTADLTYAEYAREGFAQLLAASALTLAVIAAAARWGQVNRLLLGALCALTLVVLASALTRLGLYMDAYGFTRLRLTAHATILWLGGVFALLLIAGATRRAGWLPRATVALTAAAVLAFAASNPDRRVAERNLERSGPVDERVLRELSADAAPALPCRLIGEVQPDGVIGFNLARARARDACSP